MFTSFNLAQGYLQFAMDEADIYKTAFHAGSSGLYEFTCLPFGLTQVLVFVILWKCAWVINNTLLLLFYLNDICAFSSTVDEMLDRIGLVFNCLKEFNLKINPRRLFFNSVLYFWVMYFLRTVFH